MGAELAGWAYPASMLELLQLSATIADKKAFIAAAPWTMGEQQRRRAAEKVTPDEIAVLDAQLDEEILFS